MKDLTHQALPYLNCCLFFCCYLQLLLVIISNTAACWKLWHGASTRGWTWIEPNWLWAWCKHVCMYICMCDLIAMHMLPPYVSLCLFLLFVSALLSCVLYDPMYSYVCCCLLVSCMSACCLLVCAVMCNSWLCLCLLSACLCCHVWLMLVLVLVL